MKIKRFKTRCVCCHECPSRRRQLVEFVLIHTEYLGQSRWYLCGKHLLDLGAKIRKALEKEQK